ncbi:MAG: OPT/YSL family transporter, partial [Candidatus Poseidoniales archaeon]
VIPGAILGAGVAIFLSKLLAEGAIDLQAPQANAFASFTIILAEGEGDWIALGLGFALGGFVEWATGMGTSFGLGMYLPTPITFPMLAGGAARDWWEKRRLQPKVESIRLEKGPEEAEKSRALLLLFTFMIAAGAMTGEAFHGVESAILAVADEIQIEQSYEIDSWAEDTYLDEILSIDSNDYQSVINYANERNCNYEERIRGLEGLIGCPETDSGIIVDDAPCKTISLESVVCSESLSVKSWWPQARFAVFIAVNTTLILSIYVLFKSAGIIGTSQSIQSDDENEIMDAELAD